MSGDNKSEEDYENYDRRRQLYHAAFEDYDSIKMTYYKFYTASDAMKRRGRVLTYGSTLFAAILLLIIGNIVVRGGPEWGTDLAFAVSVIVGTLSFFNAVDRPKRKSNIIYKSGQQLQRVYQEYHYLSLFDFQIRMRICKNLKMNTKNCVKEKILLMKQRHSWVASGIVV